MSRPPPERRREILTAELREAIQNLLTRGLADPRVQGLITITGVDCDDQMTQATVHVSVLPEKNQAKVIAGLRHAAKHLRHQLGEAIRNVRIPTLVFVLDTSTKRQAAVFDALAKVAAERDRAAPLDAAPPAGNNDPAGPAPGNAEPTRDDRT